MAAEMLLVSHRSTAGPCEESAKAACKSLLLSQIGQSTGCTIRHLERSLLDGALTWGIFPSLQGGSVRSELWDNQLVSAGECGIRIALYVRRKLIYQVSEEAWFVTVEKDMLGFPIFNRH